jgi:hypothetical protein
MFGSFILDVAIGMAFVYLLLSLVASGVNEILASIVQSRAANLERGLRSLLSGDSLTGVPLTLVDQLYDHGLIRGLYPDPVKDLKDNSPLGWLAGLRVWLQKRVGLASGQVVVGVKNPLLLPSYIPSRTFALAMIDILSKTQPDGKTPIENIESFLASSAADPKNKAAEALMTLVKDAKSDVQSAEARIQRLQKNLEDWYNDAMDRVSGWYKRYTQRVLLTVGLVLAIAFNVNSITIAHLLWVNREVRDGMVSAASDYLKTHPNAPVSGNAPATDQTAQSISEKDLIARMESSVKAVDEVSGKYMLPVGWRHSRSEYLTWWRADTVGMALNALVVLAGWLITAGALSLGASFWFDMLNKIMVVRNTVKPQEKSQTEASKDN